MGGEQVEEFISGLIKKTKKGTLNWKEMDKLDNWKIIKEEIEISKEINLKDYFIEGKKSYVISKCGGYVILLKLQYGNASVFSSALDKYILVIKISEEFLPINLSAYDVQGYKDSLKELIDIIETKKYEKIDMPDRMYEFFEMILEDDKNGRTIYE